MNANQQVRLINNPGEVGLTTGKTREFGGQQYIQVKFPSNRTQYYEAGELEEVADEALDPFDLLELGRFAYAHELRRNLTYVRLTGRLANLIYSMATTNTDFYAYQFKPVLRFLDSPSNGLLIADEVGLGKTIEAGLVWTELRARFDARRLMVLCPSMLREKWRSELRDRFGIDAQVLNAAETLAYLKETRDGKRHQFAVVCSMQGLRPGRDWDRDNEGNKDPASMLARFLRDEQYGESLIDLLVVDEAHYMRNPETKTAALGRLLRVVAEHVVLLSATPIHLRNRDLFQLVNLVDEQTFSNQGIFDWLLEANAPLVRLRDRLLAGRLTPPDFVADLQSARADLHLAGNRQLEALVAEPPTAEQLADPVYRSHLAWRLENANLLGHAVTRTRKRDVKEWQVLRQAVPERVPLSPPERRFYEAVTGIVRDYAEGYAAHEGFLLVMPQRQMSSSMPAALRAWQRRSGRDTDEMYEDLGDSANGTEEVGPVLEALFEQLDDLGGLTELWENDSKFQRLRDVLKKFFRDNPGEKVVLFSYFRATLDYLYERLRAEGIESLVLKGGAGVDKQAVIDKFRESGTARVLLSSEVASEGVDLQFCRVLVNYDLPWNPMRVEQRIGRIDRLGQQASKVLIWNLLYGDTIDDRIYERLYLRLGVFERALGGLEAILGDEVRTLTLDLLRGHLSPEQEAARIEQTAQAIANIRKEEEQLENEASNLVAHGDYILNQVRAARELQRWITGTDLLSYTKDFLTTQYPGSDFRQVNNEELLFDVRLSEAARFDLEQFLRERQLLGQTRLASVNATTVRCRFENRVAGHARGQVEQVSQFHPLVRFVSHRLGGGSTRFYPTIAVEVNRTEVPGTEAGDYLFLVQHWSVRGVRDIERLVFVARPLVEGSVLLPDERAEQLVNGAAQKGRDWHAAGRVIDLRVGLELAGECLAEADRRYKTYVREIEAENADRADVQTVSLTRHRDRQLARLEEVRARHQALGRTGLVKATEGQMVALKNRVARKLTEIDQRRTITSDKGVECLGVIRVQ